MKISIEIDSADGSAVVQTADDDAQSGSATERSAPPEVLARAAALGARDGGAAPAQLPQSAAPPVPAVIAGQTAAAPATATGGEGAISAGAAPVDVQESPSQTIEQDPDAPSTPAEEG